MVKYCQECGNASYDSAPKCGNCGAKLPPKSEANSTPPNLKKQGKTIAKSQDTSSIFSNKSESEFTKSISKRINGFDLNNYSNAAKEKKAREELIADKQSSKPSFSKTATEGFKQKQSSRKNPATKFNNPKTEKLEKAAINERKTSSVKETVKEPKKEIKKVAKKEEKEIKANIIKKSDDKTGGINFKKIGIIAIIIIIILIIAGIGINTMQNQTTDEVMHYSDGVIDFDYSGNWSMYNNTNSEGNSSDIAFKTKDNTLIGFTTIQSDEITYDKILSDVNATAHSLNGELLEYKNIYVNGVPSEEITISTADQGYSRYICILRDGVYYSFVINNGKSSNQDISALNTTEIQNMISSITFADSINNESTY